MLQKYLEDNQLKHIHLCVIKDGQEKNSPDFMASLD